MAAGNMLQDNDNARAPGSVRHKPVEIATALILFAIGAIVMLDSARIGARWAEDGPQSGYFPFYIGLLICVASAANLFKALTIRPERDRVFVQFAQLKQVFAVLLPTAAYAALVGWLGIYVASTLFIAFFMRRLGNYPWWKLAPVSVGTSVVFFLIFEIWFKIPLPKGPLESALGLG